MPVTKDDLSTAEGAITAKQRWQGNIISYPCHYCGKPIDMTREQLRFLSITMLSRYRIGALPTCSRDCAEKLVAEYENCKNAVIEPKSP